MDPNFCVVYIGGRRVVCRRPMLAFLLPCWREKCVEGNLCPLRVVDESVQEWGTLLIRIFWQLLISVLSLIVMQIRLCGIGILFSIQDLGQSVVASLRWDSRVLYWRRRIWGGEFPEYFVVLECSTLPGSFCDCGIFFGLSHVCHRICRNLLFILFVRKDTSNWIATYVACPFSC